MAIDGKHSPRWDVHPRQPRWVMATATSASNASSTAASSGQGGDNLPGDPASTGQQPAAATTPPADPAGEDGRFADPLKTERRKNNQLEKEIRT